MIKKYLAFIREITEKMDREPLGQLIEALVTLQKWGGRLFILGVGGSAANASHAASDFRKLTGIEAYSFDNMAEMTARTNDEGWDNVFADWLKVFKLSSHDMVLVFSVGGGTKDVSKNLVEALKYAKEVGAKTAGIVGRDGGYTKKIADICILIPTVNKYLVTPFVESFQAIIWHLLVFLPALNINSGKWESIELE